MDRARRIAAQAVVSTFVVRGLLFVAEKQGTMKINDEYRSKRSSEAFRWWVSFTMPLSATCIGITASLAAVQKLVTRQEGTVELKFPASVFMDLWVYTLFVLPDKVLK